MLHKKINRQLLMLSLMLVTLSGSAQIKVDYFMSKGFTELYNEQYTEAIQTLNILIRARPDLADPHILRGRAKLALGDFRGAEFDFTRAVMLDSYNPDAYYYRGVVKSNLFDYYSALQDFEKSLDRRPNNPNVFFSRGTTRLRMKEYKMAITDFDTLILLRPDIEEAYLNRALAKASIEDYEGAIRDCNRAIGMNLFFMEAYVQRGLFKNETGDIEGAMKDFDQAIKLDKNDPLTYFYRGAAEIKLGDTAAALEDFSTVVKLDPYNDLTFYNRALIKMQRGNYREALNDFDKVLGINPENVYTWYNRGIANAKLKKFKEAAGDFSKAIELFPDFAAAYMSRAQMKQELKKHEEARQDYDIAVAITNAVNSGEDFGMINARYSADSTYLQKIIEFEADFNTNNIADGRIQNRRVLIQLKPNFSIQLYDTREVLAEQKETGYHWPALEIFSYNSNRLSLGITARQYDLTPEEISLLSGKIDSVMYFSPFDSENYLRAGIFNAMMLNYNEAVTSFNRAIELDPEYLEAYFNRANINFELIEHRFAMQESATSITLTNQGGGSDSAEPEPELPDFSQVIGDYNTVIRLNPGMSYAYYNRGNIKNRMRDFEGAIEDYTIAIGLEPDFAEAFYNRALTLIYLKRNADACLDLSKAGELGIEEAYNVIKRYCNR